MLEHVPKWIGALLHNVRAGHAKLAIVQPEIGTGHAVITVTSPAFANGARLPERFTADGEGVSPPLLWSKIPDGTRSLVLIVEDPDAPAMQPLVHALVWSLPASATSLREGEIRADTASPEDRRDVGRNSYFTEGWLPPDPPTGHGSHDYVFQLFALDETPDIPENPGRSAVLKAMAGRVIGAGMLVGTYSRGEEQPVTGGHMARSPIS